VFRAPGGRDAFTGGKIPSLWDTGELQIASVWDTRKSTIAGVPDTWELQITSIRDGLIFDCFYFSKLQAIDTDFKAKTYQKIVKIYYLLYKYILFMF